MLGTLRRYRGGGKGRVPAELRISWCCASGSASGRCSHVHDVFTLLQTVKLSDMGYRTSLNFLSERCKDASSLWCGARPGDRAPGMACAALDPWQRWLHPSAAGQVRSRSALRHGVCHHAQDLEHQIGPIEGGVPCGVEWGRHLTDIAPNELQPPQPPQHHLRIPHAQPSRFRRPRADGVDGIEPVDVERNIGRPLPRPRGALR